MGVRKFRPITPGQRHKVLSDFNTITAAAPEKALVKGRTKSGGRNNSGRMTMRYLGGGHKKKYRAIDFLRNNFDIPGTVKTIEYDPNRSARIALVYFANGDKRYVIAPQGLEVGQTIMSGEKVAPEIGNTMPLAKIPLGTLIHNIELTPGRGGILARSAGSYAQLAAREGKYVTVKLPSGETRMILTTCLATIGTVSNSEHNLQVSGKAGRSRCLGRRPRVRGVVMNPVDHPMGGGEGKTSGGGHPVSPWGQKAKGLKTRKQKKESNRFIIKRRKK